MKKRFHTFPLLLSVLSFFSLPVLAQWSSATLSQQNRSYIAAASIGNKVMFAGGYRNEYFGVTSRIDIYDVITNQWTTTELSLSRGAAATVKVDNLLFFAGGMQGYGVNGITRYANVDIYNATTNQWTSTNLSAARTYIAATQTGGKAFFVGGNGTNVLNRTSDAFDIYDVATNTWSTSTIPANLPSPRAVGIGNKVIVNSQSSASFIYDIITKQWISGGPATGASIAILGNKVFFAGKIFLNSGNRQLSDEVNIYDASTDQWTTAKLSVARTDIAAISLGSKVFFAGGTESKVVDIYDATTNQWTTAQLSQSRTGASATSVGNKIFFAGGADTKAVDIYDATTDQWSVSQLPLAKMPIVAVSAGERALFAEVGPYATNNNGFVDIYTTNSALPVNLISFSGAWTENIGAQLIWQTSLETNNDHFEIQRSDNAKSFETIGRVQGKGTTEARTDYSFTDPDMPDQIGYYRLKQVDFDGSAHFSNIISVNRREGSPQAASLSIWPLPATGSLNLKLSTSKAISQIAIYDLQGRQRLYSQLENQSTTDISSLPAGVYLLDVLTTDGQRLHKHFLKH